MTLILGLSAFYHDSAVALIDDGRVVAAASEERFTRIKHDAAFPKHALDCCLESIGATASDLDYVGFYEKPLLKFDRLLEDYLAYAPRGYRSFANAMPSWLRTKLRLPREIRQQLGGKLKHRVVFCEHHQSHAASAFFPSPFQNAAILTLDGVGEWTTTGWGVGQDHRMELKQDIRFPHSLGLLYSAFTYFCGFRVNSGEYKLMGLAPYGQPRFVDLIRKTLIRVHEDGSYDLNMDYFTFGHTLRMSGSKLERLLGTKRRLPNEPIRQVDMDIAASIQRAIEAVILQMAKYVHHQTGLDSLCLAGGVALNCVANGRLLREGPFKNVWIQPAAGDAGGALGVAWLIWHQLLNHPRQANAADAQQGSLLGPAMDEATEMKALTDRGAVVESFADRAALDRRVCELIVEGKVVGWVQGRMEFGPRALGNRSILADPRRPEMQTTLNLKIKRRESFRPFAPAILEEHAEAYFEMGRMHHSPYMLFTFQVQPSRRIPSDPSVQGIERVRQSRSDLPAITHLDYSARVQTVCQETNPRFHSLLSEFFRQTGCPALINTSFNVRGEPIVRTAAEAYRCFMATQMDALVVGNHLMLRNDQPETAPTAGHHHLSEWIPD
ncbi:carbamoyltransferase family protein [Novipirellula artificiosorum]|uniref:Decarbamoylnovobiocin carbamoyltransferase n=1 Tax=Novipirellula artificiosorum TaxID=2528016 RepID=A0A5C6DUM5_9BACT|nr:carbamoyltransferase [Novipirellula artificiosorum]TWU38469.1 Decarbamoylnovobiocin carbamoyltransferase [Novipirellula artificiosorum]